MYSNPTLSVSPRQKVTLSQFLSHCDNLVKHAVAVLAFTYIYILASFIFTELKIYTTHTRTHKYTRAADREDCIWNTLLADLRDLTHGVFARMFSMWLHEKQLPTWYLSCFFFLALTVCSKVWVPYVISNLLCHFMVYCVHSVKVLIWFNFYFVLHCMPLLCPLFAYLVFFF